MDDKGRELCPRLIDFVVLVGRRNNSRFQSHALTGDGRHSTNQEAGLSLRHSSSKGGVCHPELQRRYPSENHKDFELPTDVTYFCQPEGCVTIGTSQRRSHALRDTTSFVFTLTEKDSARIRYGLCLISHHPFLTIFREVLVILRQLIDACNARCNQDEALPRDAVWSVLMGHWAKGPVPGSVMEEIRQIETWILLVLSSPVPVPGKTKVVVEILPPDIMPMLEFALPDHTRFCLVDFPLHLPIELLGVDTVTKLLAAIMLEYKVVLQSRNYSAVSMCVLALVALMYPLEYMFPVIPLLPACMGSAEQLLLAPTPYIIGLPASFFAVKCIDIPTDVVFVDLDTNEVIFPQGMDIHMFPEPEASDLKDAFRRALGKMSSTNTLDNSDTVSRSSGYESGHAVDGDEIDVAVRVAMNYVDVTVSTDKPRRVRFFNSANIFANFSEHSRTLRLYPRPVVALQTESFLRSRPQQTDFIVELCKTQAVEYFSECSLCPRNETYVRVQAGITNPTQIGDKSKWFTDQLMPIHFNAYPNSASLSEALYLNQVDKLNSAQADNSDGEDTSDLESTCSGMDESVYFSDSSSLNNNSRPPTNLEMFKPLSEVNDIYKAPKQLKMPQSESALSIESSISSGRSSPASSLSASAIDSEADFARLADNLALKSDSKGDFTFDHENDTYSHESQYSGRRSSLTSAVSSTSSTPTGKNVPGKMIKGKDSAGEKVFGPQLMDTINGYAEKSQGMLSQVFRKTAPKLKQAQALRDKTMRPLAEAAANKMEHGQHLMNKKTQQNNDSARSSLNTANTQRKNQQLIAEVCDQIIAGQGVGVFTYPKVKRLLEDESLRELACSKLQNYTAGQQRNCPKPNLDDRYSVDEFVQDVQLTRAQYKGYLKVLQACVVGLESSFNLPGSNGLASLFHVLEIAHTHFWAENEPATPGSGIMSLISTPSGSNHNLSLASTNLPNSDLQVAATIEHDLGAEGTAEVNTTGSVQNSPINQNSSHSQESAATAHASVEPSQSSAKSGSMPPTTLPPPLIPPPPLPAPALPQRAGVPPPLPPRNSTPPQRPPPPRQASVCSNALSISSDVTGNCVGDTSTPKVMDLVQQTAPNKPIVPIALVKTSEKAATQVTAPESKPIRPKAIDTVTPSSSASHSTPVFEQNRHYLYKDLIMSTKTDLWQKMVFWENAFFDMVAQEREIIGMDQEPSEMIDRYSGLSDSERKRLELDEDRILATLLHNMTAYMIMCGAQTKIIQQKVRRLLGKAHIGLVYSKKINQLLDDLQTNTLNMQTNGIPLKPLESRLTQKQTFVVYNETAEGDMFFMEVCDDAVILRGINGEIAERWWYERLVNMTFSPKTRVLCLWRRQEDQVLMHKFYTKKCRHLYNYMKTAMERAASRGKVNIAGRDLGGEFPVHDIERNEGGLLQVRIDGIALLFANRQEFIDLSNIKKCNTFGGNMFVLEEFNHSKNHLIQRRYISSMSDKIAWSLHRVFSIKLALGDCRKKESLDEKGVVLHRTGYPLENRCIVPLAVPTLPPSHPLNIDPDLLLLEQQQPVQDIQLLDDSSDINAPTTTFKAPILLPMTM